VAMTRFSDRKSKDSELRHGNERQADKDQIVGLNTSIQNLNKDEQLQYERHQKELNTLNDKLADLKKDIATEDLRKKIQALQGLLNKSLAPSPKAKLEVGLYEAPGSALRSEIYAPMEGDHVAVRFSVVNHTDVAAKNVELWVRICDVCKYSNEPVGSAHPAGAEDKERYWGNIQLAQNVQWQTLTLDLEIPSPYTKTFLVAQYRCDACELEKDWRLLSINLGRPSLPRFAPTPLPSKKPRRKVN
jgi:hypothetical protein